MIARIPYAPFLSYGKKGAWRNRKGSKHFFA